jgi:hypothetical protein
MDSAAMELWVGNRLSLTGRSWWKGLKSYIGWDDILIYMPYKENTKGGGHEQPSCNTNLMLSYT